MTSINACGSASLPPTSRGAIIAKTPASSSAATTSGESSVASGAAAAAASVMGPSARMRSSQEDAGACIMLPPSRRRELDRQALHAPDAGKRAPAGLSGKVRVAHVLGDEVNAFLELRAGDV